MERVTIVIEADDDHLGASVLAGVESALNRSRPMIGVNATIVEIRVEVIDAKSK